jgi:Plasmid pRiA4b ORF-3-like protein
MSNDHDTNQPGDGYEFDLPSLSDNPTMEEIQAHMAIIEAKAKEELGVELNMAALFEELAQMDREPTLMDITDLIAQKIANAKALLGEDDFTALTSAVIPEDAQFIMQVTITHQQDIWRTFAFNPGHSLSHVHLAIQQSFDFDGEQLYAFYLDNRIIASKKFYNDPRTGEPPFANEHTLAELGLIPLQRILYVYDFDDLWEFHVDLLEVATGQPTSPYPILLEANGDSPLQNGGRNRGSDFEEEDEEDW